MAALRRGIDTGVDSSTVYNLVAAIYVKNAGVFEECIRTKGIPIAKDIMKMSPPLFKLTAHNLACAMRLKGYDQATFGPCNEFLQWTDKDGIEYVTTRIVCNANATAVPLYHIRICIQSLAPTGVKSSLTNILLAKVKAANSLCALPVYQDIQPIQDFDDEEMDFINDAQSVTFDDDEIDYILHAVSCPLKLRY